MVDALHRLVEGKGPDYPEWAWAFDVLPEASADHQYVWPSHPLFKLERVGMLFTTAHNDYEKFSVPYTRFTRIGALWRLETAFSIKNYQNELQALLDWLLPYMAVRMVAALGIY